MNRASLKKSIILAMSSLPEVEGLENNDIILTTPAGNICGKLFSDEDIDNAGNFYSVLSKLCRNVADEHIKNSPSEENAIVGNDGYLILKNVKIRSTSSATVTSLPYMVVFYDRIIGISVGTIN